MDLSYNSCRLRAALLEHLSVDDDSGYIDALISVADPIFAQLPETTPMAKLATLYCAVAAHFWTDDDAPDAPFDVLRARGVAPALPYLVFWPVTAPRESRNGKS